MEHPELLPQLPVNVAVVLRGQIITEETSAVPTEIGPMTVSIRRLITPTVGVLMTQMEIGRMTAVAYWKITATAETLVALKQIITITMLIHGRITVPIEIPVILMETNTVNIVTRRQLITIEKDLMTVLMRIAVEAVAVRSVMITE